MSHFYGIVSGQSRTEATRRGSKKSGISASIGSWSGGISVALWYDETENVDRYSINLIPWQGVGKSAFVQQGILNK